MLVLMHTSATPADVQTVLDTIQNRGLTALEMPGGDHVAIGIPSAIPPTEREPLSERLTLLPGVANVVHITRSYKLASREFHPSDTAVEVGTASFGSGRFTVIAGPCSVENRDQIFAAAHAVKSAGASMLRGGAFKPRTSPYAFQGLHEEGLRLLQEAAQSVGLPCVTEVIDSSDIDLVSEYADMLQIGARNMQNFPLLIAAGKSHRPVLLKRGPSASLDEFLLAAEYVLHHGNPNVVLCERGVHPLDRGYTRNTLDLNAVPVLKELTHLPVIVDPSHGIGIARHVPAMCLGSAAVGADGMIVEVHPAPKEALSDGQQSLTPEAFTKLMSRLAEVCKAVDKPLAD